VRLRILDRYLLREFLLPLIYCLDAFALLWIVSNLFGTLDDFIDNQVGFGQIVRYYLVTFPEALVQIVPMSLLLGLLFCLANLGKHHELLAMRAGGVSLTRIATPLLAVGLLATLLVLGVNELFVPGAKDRAGNLMRQFRGKAEEGIVENLFFNNPRENRDWYIRRYNTQTRELENPEIHERNPDGTPRRDIYADRARWVDGRWIFYDVDLYDQTTGATSPLVERHATIVFPHLTERPNRLVMENKKPSAMTSRELRGTIRSLTRANRLAHVPKLRVELHYRYAFPVTCLMVMWLGIPLGLQTNRGGALRSVGVAIALVIAYHFVTNIALALGGGGHLPPPLAAWFTNLIFAGVGAVLFWRIR